MPRADRCGHRLHEGRARAGGKRFVGRSFVPLGTDGFGRSDTRESLRRHFEVGAPNVVVAVLASCRNGDVKPETVRSDRSLRHRPRSDRPGARLAGLADHGFDLEGEVQLLLGCGT
jgi:hypothetical protein